MTRHFLTVSEVSDDDLAHVYSLATSQGTGEELSGQGVALFFERPSLRTRAASAMATADVGGVATFFGESEIGLDQRESAEDVSRLFAQMYRVAAMRLRSHTTFDRMLAATSDSLSLVNLLSDVAHPTQAVADVLTMADEFGNGDVASLAGRHVAYVGDATNVTRSLCVALLRLGTHVVVAAPEGHQLGDGSPEDPVTLAASAPGSLTLTSSAADAVADADVIYTDAWVSMGVEDEVTTRRQVFAPFQVNETLVKKALPHAIVMHCLPAHRGDEITSDVMDSPKSRVWQQARHRRSAMRGVLRWIGEQS